MLQLKKMFSGVQSLLNKMNKAKKQETREKYKAEIGKKLDEQNINRVFKEDLARQKQQEKQRKHLKKKLDAALKRQDKLNKERARQDAKLKKLREQRELSSRLLSNDERNLLLRRKYTQALDQDELNKINKKLRDDKLEQLRRKKYNLDSVEKMHGRMRKLNEKFRQLNDFVGNVKVEKSDKTTQSGKIKVYHIMPQNLRKLEFPYFLEVVKPASMSTLKKHKNSKKAQFKIKFTMVKRNPRTDEIEDRAEMHRATKYSIFFRSSDLGEFYDHHKNELITKFNEILLKGSGWELESIDGFWIYVAKYTPFSSHRNDEQSVDINELDRGEATNFNIGKFWRDKKGLIVPQNKDDNCFLAACAIAELKLKKNANRVSKKVQEKMNSYNTKGISLPPDEEGVKKFEKLNNIKIHCICAMTDGKHIEMYKAAYKPNIILCLVKNPQGQSHWCVVRGNDALSR